MNEVLRHTFMITGFVFAMMLVIEYVNVLTRGQWLKFIRDKLWNQSFLAAALGVIPGCLGAFAAVSLYTHRILTFGAITATMIATCGDEAFLMLAMFPDKALLIMAILFVTGMLSGLVVDLISKGRTTAYRKVLDDFPMVHPDADRCFCFSRREILRQWRNCSAPRGILTFVLLMFVLGVVSGQIGEEGFNWMRVSLVIVGTLAIAIVSTVPDHFLEEHLWNHIARVHIWKIFLWTLGALMVTHALLEYIRVEDLIAGNRLLVLGVACLIGLIPESGPHMIFVTLYAQGALPFSILLASCIVQDGHGMIPLLAHSRRAFIGVKAINLAIGLAVGLTGYWLNW